MAVINVTELLVREIFEEPYFQERLSCSCEQCKDDILAIALNNLPSRYVSTDRGVTYVKAEHFNMQLQSDVLREMAVAAAMVARNPRHTG